MRLPKHTEIVTHRPTGAVIIGVCAGLVPFFAVLKLKAWLGYDDALDTFGVHAVGGTMGALLTGFLATDKVNGNLSLIADAASANPATKNGLAKLVANGGLWMEQLKAMGITIVLAVVGQLGTVFGRQFEGATKGHKILLVQGFRCE